jgi:hypothetical protein
MPTIADDECVANVMLARVVAQRLMRSCRRTDLSQSALIEELERLMCHLDAAVASVSQSPSLNGTGHDHHPHSG